MTESVVEAGWRIDPDEIYRRSFAIIRSEINLSAIPDGMADVVIRVVHACGMPEIAEKMRWSANAAALGRTALRAGKPVLADADMVVKGIIQRALPAANPVLCTLSGTLPTPGTTRSAAAVEAWRPHLDGAVVVIGNAPTALFRLMDAVHQWGVTPALVLGFPVGFVGAAESKQALMESGLPYITLPGRQGGSAMAAAALNALSIPCP